LAYGWPPAALAEEKLGRLAVTVHKRFSACNNPD
jgi:hypothetical protein